MAKTKRTEPRPANLSYEQTKAAIPKIDRRIGEVNAMLSKNLTDLGDAEISALESKLDAFLTDTFGPGTVEYERYVNDLTTLHPGVTWEGMLPQEIANSYRVHLQTARAQLLAIRSGFEEKLEDAGDQDAKPSPPAPRTNKIFIVHGHDSGIKETVARFLQGLSLDPVILHERPNAGKTIIEKFEQYSQDVGFAVILLTPDDRGGTTDDDATAYQPRARQNVIFEFGYFCGALGRRRVCALYSQGVELPSDIDGLVYVAIDAAGGWRLRLAQEIKASGIDIDLNKAIQKWQMAQIRFSGSVYRES